MATQFIYNPQNASPADLERTLTKERRSLAKQLIPRFLDACSNKASHYALLIAPRGAGKTHLLTHLRHRLNLKQKELLVIPFSEEERGITTLLDILLAMLKAIPSAPKDYRSQILAAGSERSVKRAEEILDEVTGNAPVLLAVENLSDIFKGMDQVQLHALRAFFQRHPGISILASTVTLFERSNTADHPFYGFFTIHNVEALTVDGAQAYLCQLAEIKKDTELVKALRTREGKSRVRAIHHLTGGNHRLLALLSGFLTAGELDDLVQPFIRLVDRELTPYYQQRLDRLSPLQNKILYAIAAHHGTAIAVKEIADYTFTTSQTVSSQLNGLARECYVQRRQLGRESCYELREPLLRLVLDIKEGRDRPLPLIVKFLSHWYQSEELKTLAMACDMRLRPYYEAALKEAVNEIEESGHIRTGLTIEDTVYSQTMQDQQRIPEAMRSVTSKRISDGLKKGLELEKSNEFEAALSLYQELVAGESDSPTVAFILRRIIFLLNKMGRADDSLSASDDFLRRFGDAPELPLQVQVAIASFNRGVQLGELGRSEDALAAYDELLRRFGDATALPLREQVAMALFNRGVRLGKLGRSEDALAAYDELLRRFGDATALPLREQVAMALINRGVTLGKLGRSEDELSAYDALLCRFGDATELPLQERVARALYNRGVTLTDLGRSEDALAAYNELLRRFGDATDLPLQEQVAMTLVNRGIMFGELGQSEDELAAYDELLHRFGHTTELPLQEQVARALINRGVTLREVGQSEDALAAYDDLLRRFGDARELPLQEHVARALFNRGVTLGKMGRSEDVLAACNELLRRFGDARELPLREEVARALFKRGVTLGELGRSGDELAVYDELLQRFGDATELPLQGLVAMALITRGHTLSKLGRSDDELATYDELLRRFGDATEWLLREEVARALVSRGITLGELGRSGDELAAYDELLRRFGDTDHAAIQATVIRAFSYSIAADDYLHKLYPPLRAHPDLLTKVLIRWIMNQMPIYKENIHEFIQHEKHLYDAFGDMPETKLVFQAMAAVRRHAEGDKKAMLSLPIEIRQLLEPLLEEAEDLAESRG